MTYKSIPVAAALELGVRMQQVARFRERAAALSERAEVANAEAESALFKAREILRTHGLNPNKHGIVMDRCVEYEGMLLEIGVVLENGKPIPESTAQPAHRGTEMSDLAPSGIKDGVVIP